MTSLTEYMQKHKLAWRCTAACKGSETGAESTGKRARHYSQELEEEFNAVADGKECFNCQSSVPCIPELHMHAILSRLLIERMDEKEESIRELLKRCGGNWEETFMKLVIRSFGFGIQSAAFEEWAMVIDMKAIAKHRDNSMQVEAILFGQAGLLEEESIPYYYKENAMNNGYCRELIREYRFLERKFGLKRCDYRIWGYGNSTPHVRIARIASIMERGMLTLSGVCNAESLQELQGMLDCPLPGYWQNHTCIGGTETCGNGGLPQRHADIITINAIVPALYVYGKHRNDWNLRNKAEDLLHWIKGEENSITRRWKSAGVDVDCAADSQAILQLNKRYCGKKNCLECPLAYHYIKGRISR